MNKIKDYIYNILTSGSYDSLEFQVKRKIILINTVLIFSLSIFLFFTILNYLQGNNLLVTVDLISLFLIVLFFSQLRRTLNIDAISYAVTISLGLVVLFFLISGGRGKTGAMYILVYPAPVFYMLGKRKGLIAVTLFSAAALMSYLIFMNYSWFPQYEKPYIIRYTVLFIITVLLGFSYEYVFNRIHTDLEKTNSWLTDSEEKYRTLVENASIGILIIKSDIIVYANSFFIDITGYQMGSLDGKNISAVLNQHDMEAAKGKLRKGLVNNQQPEHFESTVITREGTSIDVEINLLIINFNSEPALLAILNDISKKKKAEKERELLIKQLNEILEIKDRFISVLAHDLKGPLGSYYEFMNFFEDNFDEMTDDEKKDVISSIKVSSKNNYDLLLNLLNWAKIQNDRMPFNPEILSLKEIFRETIDFYTIEAERKNIRIISNVSPRLYVYGDHDMINTIMRNLLSNAVKFSFNGGTIRIMAIELEGNVEVHVADNGKGIRKDILDELFSLNIYTKGETSPGRRSTGLGLILCRDMVEKNGGEIWAESGEEKGSIFKFTLPADFNEIA